MVMDIHDISTTLYHKTLDLLTSNINSFFVSSNLYVYADNVGKQFGPISGLTECQF